MSRIDVFVRNVTPFAVGAEAVASRFVFFGQLSLTALTVDDHHAFIGSLIVVAPWLTRKSGVVDFLLLVLGIPLVLLTVIGTIGRDLPRRALKYLFAVSNRFFQIYRL